MRSVSTLVAVLFATSNTHGSWAVNLSPGSGYGRLDSLARPPSRGDDSIRWTSFASPGSTRKPTRDLLSGDHDSIPKAFPSTPALLSCTGSPPSVGRTNTLWSLTRATHLPSGDGASRGRSGWNRPFGCRCGGCSSGAFDSPVSSSVGSG